MVATKCGAQLSVDGLEIGRYQHGTHREAVGNTLCHGDDIGFDAQPLVGKELTRTTIATLYLVANQRHTEAFAGVGQVLGKLRRRHLNASDTLDALQDDGTDAATRHLTYPRLDVVQRQKTHVVVVIQRSNNLRIVCHLDGQRRTTMESLFTTQDACSLRILERCQLQSILVGLGTTVNQEQLIVVIA